MPKHLSINGFSFAPVVLFDAICSVMLMTDDDLDWQAGTLDSSTFSGDHLCIHMADLVDILESGCIWGDHKLGDAGVVDHRKWVACWKWF